MMDVKPVTLRGHGVRLEPLDEATHAAGLRRAAEDERLWTHMYVDARGAGFEVWLADALGAASAGLHLPFAVLESQSGEIIGSTRYLNMDAQHRRMEIGHTWYVRRCWGTHVNPACKLLLMAHAFEVLGANRVQLRTDARNTRSRAAIARLGAAEEGVLRRHMIVRDGYVRDTVQFAVIDREWPEVRAGLEARLTGTPADGS